MKRNIAIIVLAGIILLITALTASDSLLDQEQANTTPAATDTPVSTATPAHTATPVTTVTPIPPAFDGQQAYQDVVTQVDFGARTPGSEAHQKEIDWILSQLQSADWQAEVQKTTYQGHEIDNIVAKRGSGSPWYILGAHYDSRMTADQDPNPQKRTQPVPGANDGASGVAVLLGLARSLPQNLDKQVWLLFIDAEDQGEIPGWDWTLGARSFADQLTAKPDGVIILDMIGDANLDIYFELQSNTTLEKQIWQVAADLGFSENFIPTVKYAMLDDHVPFLEKGIPAVDIIDFDYPYWHTTSDTPEHVSAASLDAVGSTILAWLMQDNLDVGK
ncbi:MAG TPA: M28 family peptidase [Longilinea sp.]|nr:M28 family peptidase [Longilinea sp.]